MSKPKEIQIPGKNYFAWEYEEQTKVKHKVLGSYAKIWISKLGYKRNTLFFDCHGGCGAYIDDKNMAAGAERVEKPGKPAKVKIVSRVYKDAAGKQITEELGRVVVEPAENTVIRRGLARSIKTPQGYKRYSKRITCEATAYTHTGYRTATGIMPYVGVVAVDPRYIPLGTKMFIPGYGMALAADTGGDMIHHRIDVFLNTEYECIQWGRRNVEVYILEE